jgi:lipoyl(octanoyl) transferase
VIARVLDLGRLSYSQALQIQHQVLEEVIQDRSPSTLLLVEHDPVLTLGANFHSENLLFSEAEYRELGMDLHQIDRGGDVTYHGPGQLVVYPIFNLRETGQDLHLWLRQLEETVLQALVPFGLEGRRFAPHTGVWVGDKKIAAIGIKVRKWVSFHGLAWNVDLDLTPFHQIIPCGIQGYGVTSLAQELGRSVGMEGAKSALLKSFETVFSLEWEPTTDR